MSKRAALYLRQSVTKGRAEDSTSLAVQEDVCRRWCADHGYAVVGVFVDPDTSGAKTAPVDREGWRDLLACDFDVVAVYKFDRLARDEHPFAATVAALAVRGQRLVSATEGEDRFVASLMSVVSAKYSREHAERTSDARWQRIKAGKAVGGAVPYGYKRVRHESGEGWAYVQDAETIRWVKGMVERARRGDSIHSVRLWLNAEGVPSPTGRPTWESWQVVSRIIRHPFLWGAVPYNPKAGGQTKTRGDGLLRDDAGRVKIHKHLAVMSREDHAAMVAALDAKNRGANKPYASRAHTSALLSGLVFCGRDGLDGPRMWRGTVNGRHGYICPECSMSISHFEDAVVDEFLRGWGDVPRMHRVETADAGGADEVADLTRDIEDLQGRQRTTDDEDAYDEIGAQIKGLMRRRAKARERRPVLYWSWEPTGQTYAEAWQDAAGDVAAQRRVLDDGLQRVTVLKGRPGRRTSESLRARLMFDWVPDESWVDEPA